MPSIVKINPANPDEQLLGEVVRIMREGGVIAYPTETFYGLGADAQNEQAVDKIFRIKGREAGNPLPLIIGNEDDLTGVAEGISAGARELIRSFWPGALTLVFPASARLPARLTAGTGTIGIRISSHPLAALLARKLGRPLTATSANPSGTAPCTSAEEVIRCLGDRIDAVVDGGVTAGGLGSTILDVTVDPPVVLREGVIPSGRLQKWLKGV